MNENNKKINLIAYIMILIIIIIVIGIVIIYIMQNKNANNLENIQIKNENVELNNNEATIKKDKINYYTYSQDGKEMMLILVETLDDEGYFIFNNTEYSDSGAFSDNINGYYNINGSMIELSHLTKEEEEYNSYKNIFNFTGIKMETDEETKYSKFTFEYNKDTIKLGNTEIISGNTENSKGMLYKDSSEKYLLYLVEDSNNSGFFEFVSIEEMSIDQIGGYFYINESGIELSHLTKEEEEYNLYKNIFNFTGAKMETDEETKYSKFTFEYNKDTIKLGDIELIKIK